MKNQMRNQIKLEFIENEDIIVELKCCSAWKLKNYEAICLQRNILDSGRIANFSVQNAILNVKNEDIIEELKCCSGWKLKNYEPSAFKEEMIILRKNYEAMKSARVKLVKLIPCSNCILA